MKQLWRSSPQPQQRIRRFPYGSPTVESSLTADAIIRASISASFTADAVLRRTGQPGSFTLDAVINFGGSGAIAVDAVIRRLSQPGGFTVDAVLRRAQGASFAADAVIRKTASATFTADAVLKKTPALSFTADSILRRTQSATFTADAWIGGAAGSGTFTIDAVLRVSRSGSLTANAIVRRTQSFGSTADAILRKTISGSFTANAVIEILRTFTANAVIRKTQTSSFTASAWIYAPRADPGGPGGPGETPMVSIIVDGEDITDDVVLKDAEFTMLVNGAIGTCRVRVRDDAHTRTFITGSEITVDIDGKRRFGGYILSPKRMLAFPVEDTTDPTKPSRFHVLVGVDYNILLTKRVVRNKTTPAAMELRHWPAGSRDDVIIKYVFDNYTDLAADGITYHGVTHIGSPNPDKPGVVGSGGLRFVDTLKEVNRLLSGVFYIDAYKDLNYVDVDTPDAVVGLSDRPGVGEVGYREMYQTSNGAALVNDAMVWGAGQGSNRMVFSRVQSEPSITAHGRWQMGEFTSALFRQASVDLRASTIVNGTPQSKRGGKDDQESWRVVTYNNTFEVGQKVAIESEVFDRNDVVPIRRLTMTFPTKTPRFELVLSHEIDEPWNLFEFWFPKFPPFRFGDIDIDSIIDLPPETDAECACGITDTFSRDVAEGWGTSEAMIPYQQFFSGPATNSHVSGGYGTITSDTDYQDPLVVLNYPPEPDAHQQVLVKLRYTDPQFDGGNSGDVMFGGNTYRLEFAGDGSVWARSAGGDGTMYTPSVNILDWFWLRFDGSTTVFRYKIWQDGDTEPGTWVDENPYAGFIGGVLEFELDNHPFQEFSAALDVDDLQVAGLDACSAIQFDDFQRGSPGPDGWAVATPSGIPWVVDSKSTRGHAFVSSSNGYGRAYVLNGTFPSTQGGIQMSAAFPAGTTGDYTLRSRMRFGRIPQPPSGASCGYFFYVTLLDGRSISVDIQTSVVGASATYVDFVLYDEDFNVISNDTTVVGADWDVNEWATVSIVVTATTAALTILVEGDAAPVVEAQLTDTGLTGAGARVGAGVNCISNDPSSVFNLDIDYIDFNYDGRPCFCGGGAEAVFDDFARANTTGFEEWGTAPGGEVYTYAGMGSVNGAAYITDGIAYHEIMSGSPQIYFGPYLPSGDQTYGPWLKPQWTFSCKFKTPHWTYDGSDASIDGTGILEFEADTRSIFLTMGTLVDGDLNVEGHGSIQTDDSDELAFDWHPDTWYRVKWYYDIASGDSWLKVWLDGDTEPDWMITHSSYGGFGGDTQPEYFSVRSQHFAGVGMPFDDTNPAIFAFDDFTFSTCEDEFPGAGGGGALGRDHPTGDGSTTVFTLASGYLPGSVRAFVDGYYQIPGADFTETDPEAGTVTFASAPALGAAMTIFFEPVRV